MGIVLQFDQSRVGDVWESPVGDIQYRLVILRDSGLHAWVNVATGEYHEYQRTPVNPRWRKVKAGPYRS